MTRRDRFLLWKVLIDMTMSAVPSMIRSDTKSALPGMQIRFMRLPGQSPLAPPACVAFEAPQARSKLMLPSGMDDGSRAWGVEPIDWDGGLRSTPPAEVTKSRVAELRRRAGLDSPTAVT